MDFTGHVEQLGLGSAFSVAMATQFLEKHGNATAMPHVLPWLEQLKASGSESACLPSSPWQRGCPEIIPGLSSYPVWTAPHSGTDPLQQPSEHALAGQAYQHLRACISALESQAESIRSELLSLRGQGLFQRYRAPSYREVEGDDNVGQRESDQPKATGTTSGDWNVLYLDLHNVDCASARAACPTTMRALQSLPRPYGHALFSALAPRTHISTHTGPTNKKLRIQLPLIVPSQPCRLRVGPHTVTLRQDAAILFDDSYQHEACNEAEDVRLVLIADIWHPDLTDIEVKFLDFVRKAHMRQAAALSASGRVPAGADFYGIIQTQREHRAADSHVFGGAHGTPRDTSDQPVSAPLTENVPVQAD